MTNEVTLDELTAGGEDQIPYFVDSDRAVTTYESDIVVEYSEGTYEQNIFPIIHFP